MSFDLHCYGKNSFHSHLININRQIVIENNVLGQVDNTKFLGVYIDQHLTWKTHVNFIAAKISKSVELLYKAKYYLPSKSLLTLYYALVYPYLTYCNLIWASSYVINLQRIYLLQKRAVLFQGPRIWNSLLSNIKNAPTFNIFKCVIKPFLRVRQDTA